MTWRSSPVGKREVRTFCDSKLEFDPAVARTGSDEPEIKFRFHS